MAKWSFSVHGVTRRIRCFVLAAEAGVGRRGWCSAFGRIGWCFYRLQKLVLAGDAGI